MKKILLAWVVTAICIFLPLSLAGCVAEGGPSAHVPEKISTFNVELPDGRVVTCVSYSGGGVSCDWENAK